MEEHGKDFINSVVGQETSGGQYNKISLDSKRRPHNPMINTGQVFTDKTWVRIRFCPLNPDKGAILMSSLFERNKNLSEKHKSIMKKVKHIAGIYDDQDETDNESSVGFDYSAFMSDTGSI